MKLKPKKETFKIGRKKFGEIITHEDGRRTFMVMRSLKDIFRGKGNGYISHGIQEGVAAWSVETLLLSKMKSRDIDCIAIKVRENGSVYITPLERFVEESRVLTQRRRNGSMQRSLPLTRFAHKPGKVKL